MGLVAVRSVTWWRVTPQCATSWFASGRGMTPIPTQPMNALAHLASAVVCRELAAICRATMAREGRLWWVVEAGVPQVEGPHGLGVAARLTWREGGVEVDGCEVAARSEWVDLATALPDPSGRAAHRVVRVGVGIGQRWAMWVADPMSLHGALELVGVGGGPRGVIGSERVQRLAKAVGAAWRRLPTAGGTAMLRPDGTLECATERARASIELLGLPLGRVVGMGCGGVVDLGFAVGHIEVARGEAGNRLVVRFAPARPMSLASEAPLSARQLEVARLAADGLRVADIATALGCAETTVKTHLRAAYAVLGVASRVELLKVLGDGGRRDSAGSW